VRMYVISFLSALSLLFTLFSTPAEAYLGPGLGTGILGVIAGVLAFIVLTFVAIVWYPIKRFFKKRKRSSEPNDPNKNDIDKVDTL
jgi:hypothetical protein